MDKQQAIESLIKASIISWIPIPKESRILCVEDGNYICSFLREHNYYADPAAVPEKKYSHVICISHNINLKFFLQRVSNVIDEKGVLYLAADNTLGLRFFCGDMPNGNTYTKSEIELLLYEAGFNNNRFYSVLPNFDCAQLVYSEDSLPKEKMAARYIPMYNKPDFIIKREEILLDSILENGFFHQMANSYLIECSKTGSCNDHNIKNVTLSPDRGSEFACITRIFDNKAEKLPMCKEGREHVFRLTENEAYLKMHGINVIEGKIVKGIYTVPYVNAESLVITMKRLLREDTDSFLLLMDEFRNTVFSSSECIYSKDNEPVLKRCYIDLIPLNCFYYNNDFLFYDQEFFLENESANLILWRSIVVIYGEDPILNEIYPITGLWERYGLTERLSEYSDKAESFLSRLRNKKLLSGYNDMHYASPLRIKENIERLGFSSEQS